MSKNYWLFKSEPDAFSIDDLAKSPNQTASWEGVRNYRARNILRDEVKVGDEVFFHHSSTDPAGIAGVCIVVKAAYPDESAFNPRSEYFDSKSTKENPRWFTVDVKLVKKFQKLIPLYELRQTTGLEKMMVCQRGARLSIQPVTKEEWEIVNRLAD
jgi:predicted RNA-binding protein with PUA-like domain